MLVLLDLLNQILSNFVGGVFFVLGVILVFIVVIDVLAPVARTGVEIVIVVIGNKVWSIVKGLNQRLFLFFLLRNRFCHNNPRRCEGDLLFFIFFSWVNYNS